jgi:hypothetical protein
MFKKADQRGRNEVHGAKNNERHVVDAGEVVSRLYLVGRFVF